MLAFFVLYPDVKKVCRPHDPTFMLFIADDPSEGDLSYDWFGCDPRQSDFPLKLSPETLGFDDFMTSAARAGAHVNLVVPLDGASEFHGDDQIQTRSIGVEEMLRTATEWVRLPTLPIRERRVSRKRNTT